MAKNSSMKIFSSNQIRELDEYTIRYEPVAPAELMERAALQLMTWITGRFERSQQIVIFAGPGNNGGDGLALARLLFSNRYDVRVFYVHFTEKCSTDWITNRQRLAAETMVPFTEMDSIEQFPVITASDIIVDAVFGSGLTRPASGFPAEVIREINASPCTKISVDIPSGLFGEDNTANLRENIVKADFTLSFQFPKLSFMFSENDEFTGEWFVLPIGLDGKAIESMQSPYRLTGSSDIVSVLKKRKRFDHKGNYGHGLLISGSLGKIGAAILGSGAALRSGLGLLTCHIPSCGTAAIHCSVPEVMIQQDESPDHFTGTGPTGSYTAVAAGPGLGTGDKTQLALRALMSECEKPMVLDADALNILSMNRDWYSFLRPGIILTPHPREFERLAGRAGNGFERLERQVEFSRKHGCIVVLKGAFTSVTTADGQVFFNSTGNPGMATAGSGDVLTGILLSLLCQGYTPAEAAVTGVYIHGLAGDIAAKESSFESLIASDIINCLGKAFKQVREHEPEQK